MGGEPRTGRVTGAGRRPRAGALLERVRTPFGSAGTSLGAVGPARGPEVSSLGGRTSCSRLPVPGQRARGGVRPISGNTGCPVPAYRFRSVPGGRPQADRAPGLRYPRAPAAETRFAAALGTPASAG